MAPYTSSELAARIKELPRFPLAHLPTPVEKLANLTRAVGGPQILVKRDDLTGLAFGGNKTRQLEFILGDALARGADVLIIGAGSQSNFCRQATAAACKAGLEIQLILQHGVKGPERQGNLLLDELMGADITIVNVDSMHELRPLFRERADQLRALGRRPYISDPLVDSAALGSIGFVNGVLELKSQLDAARTDIDTIFVAAANMTQAGILVGVKALGLPWRVIGIAPILFAEDRSVDIARIASQTAAVLDLELTFEPWEVINDPHFVGPGYGLVDDAARHAFKLAAKTEGLFLDPVYTSKAMAGLLAWAKDGRLKKDERVLFWHTGGTPAIFSYSQELMGP